MFHDRTLNWSFAASLCANLVIVSLVGGSDLLKNTPSSRLPPLTRLPFIELIRPPVVTPTPVVKAQPTITHTKTVTHPVSHSVTHPAASHSSGMKPVQMAKIDVGPKTTGFEHPVSVPTDNGSSEGLPAGSGTTSPGPQPHEKIGSDNSGQGTSDQENPNKTPTVTPDSVPAKTQPQLADRAEPVALSAWPDITTSVQIDPSTLSSITITVEFEVGTDGRVSHVRVTKSSGNNELDQNAVDACEAMRWKPAVQDGIARPVTFSRDFVVGN